MKRKNLSKKIRFEVFKRDNFTCQYCGKKSPNVILHVDHINPVSKGGTNDLLNLITSCQECNSGKSNRKIKDYSVIEKKRKEIEEINEKHEQFKMLAEWNKILLNFEKEKLEKLVYYVNERISIYDRQITPLGSKILERLLKQFDYSLITECLDISLNQYLRFKNDGSLKLESITNAMNKLPGICYNTKEKRDNPILDEISKLYNMAKNKFGSSFEYNWQYYKNEFYKIYQINFEEIEEVKDIMNKSRSHEEFLRLTEDMIISLREKSL